MKNLIPMLILAFISMACNSKQQITSPQEPLMETESVSMVFEKIIEDYQSQREAASDKTDDAWPDRSESAITKEIKQKTSLIDRLKAVELTQLSDANRINHEMLTLVVEDQLYQLEYGTYLMPLSAEGGFLISMLYSTQSMRLKDAMAETNYLNKLKDTGAFIDQKIDLMNRGIEEQKKLPEIIVENCLSILRGYLSTDLEELFLSKPLMNSKVKEEGLAIIKAEVIPAFKKLENYLQDDYLPKANKKIGASQNKDGKAFYEQRVRFYTTLNMTPEEVFETGQSEVKRIRAEMNKIIEELEFEGSYADFLVFLRTDEQFYPKTPQELLSHAAWLSKKAEEILPRYFTKLPRLPFTVNPVPAAIAPTYTTGRYSGGSMERQRSGQYWVNTYNLPSRPLYVLPALTLHEAVPGHHLQISLANEIENVPKFRTQTYLSAFGEGWGLYSEYLGKEAGMYTTAYEDFGRLTYEMWRACRLVVDPGMHYMGWTKERALEYMASNTALSLHEVNTEIDRYIGWPAQAVSYKIGELKIRELRKKAELEMGDNFDIRTFHDLILENGSIPLSTLERMVEGYIASKN